MAKSIFFGYAIFRKPIIHDHSRFNIIKEGYLGMPMLCPLHFEPLFRRYDWGGRRMQKELGKSLGAGEDYAESWEVIDQAAAQSVVSGGRLQGMPLHELVLNHGDELFGRHQPQGNFPLSFKFLDVHRNLSVQVHPNEVEARKLDPPGLPETEAWVVLHAEPGSVIFAGLKRGYDRGSLQREIDRETAELCWHSFHPRVGDCVLIPAGTVRALGAGLLVAEIGQPSDTTFRLFDWNRAGADGNPQQLKVGEALDMMDFDRGPVAPQSPQRVGEGVERLVSCDAFVLERRTISNPQRIGGDDRFHILAIIEGQVVVENDPSDRPLTKGETMLLPAICGSVKITPDGNAVLLDTYLP